MNVSFRIAASYMPAAALVIFFGCSRIEFDNPFDSKGNNYGGNAPVVSLNGGDTVSVPAGGAFYDPGASAYDDIEGDISPRITVSGTVDTYNPGTYTLIYTAADQAGNTTAVRRVVIVTGSGSADEEPPIIILKGQNPMTISKGGVYTEPGVTATDYVDGDVSGNVVISGTVNTAKEGSYTVTYSVTDRAGNRAQAARTVIVGAGGNDATAPVITLAGDSEMVLSLGEPFVDPGATALDDVDGDLSGDILVTGFVDNNVAGVYTLTYSVSDMSNNRASATRTVTVVDDSAVGDRTAPVITLHGDNPLNLTVGQSYVEPGAGAVDNVDGDLSDKVKITGDVNTAVAGSYTVQYTVKDAAGNTALKTRTVNVSEAGAQTDVTPPVITLKGQNPMQIKRGASFTDPGAAAVDDVDGDLSAAITATGTVDVNTPGTYTITYSVRDAAGNTATKTRTVMVQAAAVTDSVVTLSDSDKNKSFPISTAVTFRIPASNGSGYTYTTGQINKDPQSVGVEVSVNGGSVTIFAAGVWGGQFSIANSGDGTAHVTITPSASLTITINWW